jgi:hypothetical protein
MADLAVSFAPARGMERAVHVRYAVFSALARLTLAKFYVLLLLSTCGASLFEAIRNQALETLILKNSKPAPEQRRNIQLALGTGRQR